MNPPLSHAEQLLDAAALLKANRRGIVSMVAAMACFVSNDALVKFVSQDMPTSQLIFLRGLMATVLVLAAARAMGATRQIREVVRRPVAARAAVDALATMLYLVSLFNLPIANATAINLAAPLFITVFAVIFMHEQVGWRRWAAIGAGFAGVLLIIQPRAQGFNVFALVCLAATVCHAARDLLTRRIPRGIPSILVTLSTAIAVTLLSGALSLIEGWRAFGPAQIALLGLASLFLAGGYYAIIDCMRHGEMSLVAPFRYTGLLWALIVGFLVWGDVPNELAWSGIALLVASGLYVLHRERVRARDAGARQAA
jgi:drug/metabolite transporter (DMT)-like permease